MHTPFSLPLPSTKPLQMDWKDITGSANEGKTSWDPLISDRLEKVITKLIELARAGTIIDLRPATLQYELKGEFAQLYHAAFHRINRPTWATQAFPNGFSDLVTLINQKLSAEGNPHLINTKRVVPDYRHLTAEALQAITIYRDMYLAGEITREDAINQFKEDYGIALSKSQIKRLIPNDLEPNLTNSIEDSFSARKNAIREKLNSIRREIQADFSIEACLKGLIFEGFVGAYLCSIHGTENVQTQKRFPILYTDFDGGNHAAVYTDFYLEDPGEVYEIKLLNDKKNILTSAIAQAAAIAVNTGEIVPINVIYRNPNPEVLVAVHENISLKEEVKLMGLEGTAIGDAHIQSIMRYVSIEHIFGNGQDGACWTQRLSDLETAIEGKNTLFLRTLATNLCALKFQPQFLELQLDQQIQLAANGQLWDEKAVERIITQSTTSKNVDIDQRIKAIINQRNKALDKLILDITFVLSGRDFTAVNEEVLSIIESELKFNFEQAVLEVFAQREKAKIARSSKNVSKSEDFGEKLYDALVRNIKKESSQQAENLAYVAKDMFALEMALAAHIKELCASHRENHQAIQSDPTLGVRVLARELKTRPTDLKFQVECSRTITAVDNLSQFIVMGFNDLFCNALTQYTKKVENPNLPEVLPDILERINLLRNQLIGELKVLGQGRIAKKLAHLKKRQDIQKKPSTFWLSLSPIARALDFDFNLGILKTLEGVVAGIDATDKFIPRFALHLYLNVGEAIYASVQTQDQLLGIVLSEFSSIRVKSIFLPLSIRYNGVFIANEVSGDLNASENILIREVLLPALQKLSDNQNHEFNLISCKNNPLMHVVECFKTADVLSNRNAEDFDRILINKIQNAYLERSGLIANATIGMVVRLAPGEVTNIVTPEQILLTMDHLDQDPKKVFSDFTHSPQYLSLICTDIAQMHLELIKALAIVDLDSAKRFLKESYVLVDGIDTTIEDYNLAKTAIVELARKQKQLFLSIVLEKRTILD